LENPALKDRPAGRYLKRDENRRGSDAMLRTAVAIRHVHFEDLGVFEAVLAGVGYKTHYHDIGVRDLWTIDPLKTDLVMLGAPVGVYEADDYPFLAEQRKFLTTRLAAGRPTFGICLGAQQIAASLGANVASTGVKEIGFSPLSLTEKGQKSPLRHLADVPVLHWHGDAFDIPEGALHLASKARCRHQAFAIGANIMGVQFHPEADACAGLERWLVGHATELAAAGIRPQAMCTGPPLPTSCIPSRRVARLVQFSS
jgi:GMP synthase (glutamine-hydrolysing)